MNDTIARPSTGETIEIVIPPDTPVVRVPVEAGDTVILPFPSDPDLLAKEGNGNLAFKLGDETIILKGFIEADGQHPIVVEARDGTPIDVAEVLAMTPMMDVQCACGPGPGPDAAANTGAILQPFAIGAHLSGFEAVGRQDNSAGLLGLVVAQQSDLAH